MLVGNLLSMRGDMRGGKCDVIAKAPKFQGLRSFLMGMVGVFFTSDQTDLIHHLIPRNVKC